MAMARNINTMFSYSVVPPCLFRQCLGHDTGERQITDSSPALTNV